MEGNSTSYQTLMWTLLLVSCVYVRGVVAMSTHGLLLDSSAESNSSFTGHEPLTFLGNPQSDGSPSRGRVMADDPPGSSSKQALTHHRNFENERSHQENYEALWRNANVPMDTATATKIDVLGYLLKKEVEKLRDVSNGQVELVFLVDSSASVGINNFFNELKFVKKLLADFTVAPDATRVAIITFSSKHRVELNVNQLEDGPKGNRHHKCALLNEDLPRITYVGGGTYTKGAFELAKKVLQAARPNSTQAVFLLTDGLSNGPDPTPVARSLKAQGVEVFSFGIRDGYIPELYSMASTPKDEHCYILDSFEEFEALARRALHKDLRMGDFIVESPEKCSSRCFGENNCCDSSATCRCGTHTGSYDCVCPAGFYGSGLRGKCIPCPVGSYKRTPIPGGISTCLPCPDSQQVSPFNSTTPSLCTCKDGFRWDPVFQRCQVINCPPLQRPRNGEFVEECSSRVHAACAVRCDRGHELVGSSIRLCFANGTWSGEDFYCRVKKCPEMSAPQNGSVQCTSANFAYGTVCVASCERGFRLVGSASRRCLPIAMWDGIQVTCRPIKCPMLPTIPHGTMTPQQCNTERQEYRTVCKISCDAGYERRSAKRRQCEADGRWSNQKDPIHICVDTKKPSLECPPSVTTETAPHHDRAIVYWTVPRPTDNSGETPILRAIPNVRSPWTFPLGHWNITYTAMDQAGNIARCVFSVIVLDMEPPSIKRCRSPSTFITSAQQHVVTWFEPQFSDNSGGAITITKSHDSGDVFPLGTTSVEYLATDKAGNTRSCIIYVDVQQNHCQKPRDPVGGTATCLHTIQGMNCSVTCGRGYAMSTTPSKQYFCALNGTWYPDGRVPWDDCSETHYATQFFQSMTSMVEVSDCNSDFARQMETVLAKNLKNPIKNNCGDHVKCELSSVEAWCSDRDPLPILRDSTLNRHKSGLAGSAGSKQALEGGGDLTLSADRLVLLRSPNLFFNIVINASAVTNDTAALSEPSIRTYNMVAASVSLVPDRIQTSLDNGSIETGENRTEAEETVRIGRITVFKRDLQPMCDTGSVPNGEGQDANCVKCIPGTFHNASSATCEYCPIGTYQNQTGQSGCLHCPPGSSTTHTKSATIADCKKLCEPGSRSASGLEVCELCPKNTYQTHPGRTRCLPCPDRYETVSVGAIRRAECKAPCSRGYASATGLQPCLRCPEGSFQMKEKSTRCMQCPSAFPRSGRGARTISECRGVGNRRASFSHFRSSVALQVLDFSECFSSPCRNGGTCDSVSGGSICSCAPGFSGLRCEEDVDECETAMCINNGTCHDRINGYECFCASGFAGVHCSEDLDECSSDPCRNGATCIDGPNRYECICSEGYTGTNCENEIDDCASDPCRHGGVCLDLIDSFQCTCLPGYYGDVCELEVDECSSHPCQNNATCVDRENGFSCECANGFTGDRCETDIDECSSDPCRNGGRCTDLINHVSCSCPPGFSGALCEEEMSWDFSLVFDRVSIEEYSLLARHFPSLDAVTIAFWMRTNNTENYGTVFSYAVSDSSANTLTLTDYTGFVLEVNEQNTVSDVVANDGNWHHVTATWASRDGLYELFLDGELQASGTGLGNGTSIPGGGKFILGQEQDVLGGGFYPRESFVGELTRLSVWNRSLGADEIRALTRTCAKHSDVIVAWPDFLSGLQGQIRTIENDFCQGCPDPPSPVNGYPQGYEPSRPLNRISYQCSPGHELPRYEVSSAECRVTGEWTPFDQPTCKKISCGSPSRVTNGYVSGSFRNLFEEWVEYSCQGNYTLQGPRRRQCQADGSWSHYPPQCLYIVCGEAPYVPNSVVYSQGSDKTIQRAFPGHSLVYECATGYRLHGSTEVTCQDTGQWSTPPRCDVITCTTLPLLQNPMLVTTNGSVFSSVAEYQCITGYTMKGRGLLRCHETGRWDNPPPTCSLVECGPPPDVAFATSTSDGQTFGSSNWYTCMEGYEADVTVVNCKATGHWEPSPPVCSRIQCPPPPAIDNGIMHGDDFSFGRIIWYECDLGHSPEGNVTIECDSHGHWSSDPPMCQPVNCGKPPVYSTRIGKMTDSENFLTYGMRYRYFCQEGWEYSGRDHELTCGAFGTWEGTLSDCIPVSCGPPKHIPNSVVIGNDYTFNQSIFYECDVGFKKTGMEEIVCMSDGQWTNTTLTCDIITCENPEPPEHGIILTSNLTYRSLGYLHCEEGYDFYGNGTVECQSNGHWSNLTGTCIPRSCGEPSAVEHGQVLYNGITFGNSAEYSCMDGYILKDSVRMVCTANGTWNGTQPRCEPVDCGLPPMSNNSEYVCSSTTYGSNALYICSRGYEPVTDLVMVCESSGLWNGNVSNESCVPVQCSGSPYVENGYVTGGPYIYEDRATPICDDGFQLNGAEEFICSEDGAWRPGNLTCTIITCPNVPVPTNGSIVSESITYGGTVVFSCNEGFQLDGKDDIECIGSGNWSHAVPHCSPITCEELVSPSNGSIIVQGHSYGEETEFECDTGFVLTGSNTTKCTGPGIWSRPPPVCLPVACPPPINPSYGVAIFIDNHYTHEVTYKCQPGHRLKGDRVQRCQADGKWSGQTPTCELVTCLVDGTFPHGIVIQNHTVLPNDKVIYSCNPGYEALGKDFRVCGRDGTLSGHPPTCVKVSCGPPPGLEHSNVSYNSAKFESIAVYSCHRGYTLQGLSTRQCLANASWSSGFQECRAIRCKSPKQIPYGTFSLNASHSVYRTVVEYQCYDGYRLMGPSVRTCELTGTWDNNEPTCEPITCGRPPPLQNGFVRANATVYRSEARYTCSKGYILQGMNTRVCMLSGLWTDLNQLCVPVTCDSLSPPVHGRVSTSNSSLHGIATYTCEPGYDIHGSHLRVCNYEGKWTANAPRCKPVTCPTPRGIANGRVEYTSITYKSQVTYICDEGSVAKGQTIVTCNLTGEWSHSPPRCELKSCPQIATQRNMVLSSGAHAIGDAVHISCADGSVLVGAALVICTARGTWSHALPSCETDGCGPPPHVPNGMSFGASFFPGDMVSYRCLRGYYLRGSSAIKCLPDNTWSYAPPSCIAFASVAALQHRPVCVLPCLNGGKCVGPYSCECPHGYTGTRCENVLCTSRCFGVGRCATRDHSCR